MVTGSRRATTESMSEKIRVLLVDDEPLARRGLALRLGDQDDIDIVGEAGDGEAALEQVRSLEPDLMFLDVQMPGLDGFETLKAIPASRMPLVVFVTAFDRYAIRAFDNSAVDYLLKPVDQARLRQALDRVREQRREHEAGEHCDRLLQLLGEVAGRPDLTLEQALDGEVTSGSSRMASQRLTIKDGSRIIRVPFADIRWIDAAGDYMCVHTSSETHVLRSTMAALEKELADPRFQRVHRSTLINVDRLREMRPHINGEYFLTLDCGQELKLSRSYRDRLPALKA